MFINFLMNYYLYIKFKKKYYKNFKKKELLKKNILNDSKFFLINFIFLIQDNKKI